MDDNSTQDTMNNSDTQASTSAAPVTTSAELPQQCKICIILNGTRGDLQPHLLLAIELKKRGYGIRFCTHESFREFTRDYGLADEDFCAIDGDPTALLRSEEAKKLLASGSIMRFMQLSAEANKMYIERNNHQFLEYARDCQALIYNAATVFPALAIRDYLNIPIFGVYTIPVFPTREHAPAILGMKDLPFQFLHGMLNSVMFWGAWRSLSADVNKLRTELKLKPFSNMWEGLAGKPIMYHCYSKHILPKPTDWPEDHLHVTGYLHLPAPASWQPPSELEQFLESGPKPIYLGFGSMPVLSEDFLFGLAIKLVAATGHRAVICAGWSELSEAAKNQAKEHQIFIVSSAPHDWLFPRCLLAVHHGGAGTTGSAARAGIPQVICPVLGDQPFWGNRIHKLGLGPAPVKFTDLTAASLIRAVKFAAEPTCIEKARTIGEAISAENGVEELLSLFTRDLESALRSRNTQTTESAQ